MKIRLPSCNSFPLQDSISCSQARRLFHTTPRILSPSSSSQPNPSHWLSTTRARLGHCISFGLTPSQLTSCSKILSILSTEWQSLIAGREGFVRGRAGLKRHKVVWGEMDSMGHVNNVTYVRYAETGRVEWVCNLGSDGGKEEARKWRELMTPKGERGLILKSIKVDYKFVSRFSVSLHIPRIKERQWT